MTQQKEPFRPRTAGKADIYVCGPTPYAPSHIGHARCYVIYDTLVRYLRHRGLTVSYVRNVTDVDDKIIKRANEGEEKATDVAERYFASFLADMDALGCLRPDVQPKVSDHIPEIVALIESLIAKGAAYELDGDVYFAVKAFPGYGKLSGRKIEDLRAGARVERDERKRDPVDFALWKAAKPGEPQWSSPWGPGRPGWHIECSAMALKYLGNGFDLHGGGLDLVFPHHENEIAQSEAASGVPFCATWMHNGFIETNKAKMSKSTGDFFTISAALKHVEPEALRFFFHTVHYRSPLNFEWTTDDDGKTTGFPSIEDAERRLEYLYATKQRLADIEDTRLVDGPGSADIEALRKRVEEAMADDLNTAEVLAALADLGKLANDLADRAERKKGGVPKASVIAARRLFETIGQLLGVLGDSPAAMLGRIQARRLARSGVDRAWIESKIEARKTARSEKRFADADAIRDELLARDVELKDSPQGTTWRLR
ncbi:MAG: cysteine--tRNA ligase [Deltaproteobacteria bacterium]|nr:cysteine--tRNA ligase [Deltaproteobacteria bacterium]